MAIDRAATVKKAERLLGAGKLDAAILECARLAEDRPTDWRKRNTVGDLFVQDVHDSDARLTRTHVGGPRA